MLPATPVALPPAVLQLIVPVPSLAPQAVPLRSACIILPVLASLDKVRHLDIHDASAASLFERPVTKEASRPDR